MFSLLLCGRGNLKKLFNVVIIGETKMSFRDGFETGFTPYDDALEKPRQDGGTATQTTEQKNSGAYACKIVVNDAVDGTGRRVRVGKLVTPNRSETYARAYFYFPTTYTFPVHNNSSLITVSGTSGAICWVRIVNNSSNLALVYNNGGVNTQVNTSFAIPVGVWFYIELHVVVSATAGSVAIYANGTKLFETTGPLNDSGAGIIDEVYFGCVLYDGVNPIVGQPLTFYLDDCAVDTVGPIGPVGPPPILVINVSALPAAVTSSKVQVFVQDVTGNPPYPTEEFKGYAPVTISRVSGVDVATGRKYNVRVDSEVSV
jgi:hypothetical protein